MQLEGYALVLVHGVWFVGKYDSKSGILHPAYEAHVRWMADEAGNFAILRECTPIAGSAKLNSVSVPGDAPCYDASEMSGKEREGWANAIRQCSDLIQALKAAESGLVLPPAPSALIK